MKIKKKLIKNDNQKIYSIEFENDNGFKIKFLNFGCYIQSIIIPYPDLKKSEDVIIGYENLKDIINDKSYFNSVIGRVAGRISNSFFILNKKKYLLSNNDKKNHIHGGTRGFNKKIWEIIKIVKNSNSISCLMYYNSADLEEGYPGNLKCFVEYQLNNNNQIIINYKAISDKNTLVNLTNHNYWNFNGHNKHYGNIYNHLALIKADKYCEINKKLLPTGRIIKVKGTKLNFNSFKKINPKVLKSSGIDNYFIQNKKNNQISKIAEVYSPLTKMGMTIYSNQPGVQFYSGNNMKSKYKGKKGKYYGVHYGLCFEPQKYPNAININNFPSIILKKGDIYNSKIKICLKNKY